MTYPMWAYFPRQLALPDWGSDLLAAVTSRQVTVDSRSHKRLESDEVLAALRDPLLAVGWEIETSKAKTSKIVRPVLYGDNGKVRVKQEIDGWHPKEKAILEIESGRAWQGNAIFRDLVRASLIADADYFVLGVRQRYEYGSRNTIQNDFERTRDIIDSVYSSGRLKLPFLGLLLFRW